MRTSIALAALPVFFLATSAGAETTVTTTDGGSIQTPLSRTIILNAGSALRREWVAVHDSAFPVTLLGTPGIKTIYEPATSRYSSGDYMYQASHSIEVSEPVTAVEIRFIGFNIWGERTRVFTTTEIRDFAIGEHALDSKWRLFSENEASEHYASIACVARVRTKADEILNADPAEITKFARQFMSDFTDDLLDVEPPERQ